MDGSEGQKGESLTPKPNGGVGLQPKKKFISKIEEKGLVIILAVLCVVAVVLAGLVIAGLNRGGEEEVAVDDGAVAETETAELTGEEYTPVLTTEGYSVDDANKLDDARRQAEEMLNSSSVSADQIISFYAPYIDGYAAEGEVDRLPAYVWDRNDALVSKGYKQEALDVLLAMDLTVLNDAERCRQYANIVALARSLGADSVASEYYNFLTAEVSWGDDAIGRTAEHIRTLEQNDNGGGE